MKKIRSTIFNIALIIAFTALALWLVLKDRWNEVYVTLKNASLGWILFALALFVLSQMLIGFILMIFARGVKKDYSFKDGIVNALIASFFHGITPSASGGQIVQVYVFRKQGIEVSDSASILWMDFILYQLSMVILVLGLLLLKGDILFYRHYQFFVLVLIGFLLNGFVIVGLWLIVRFPSFYTWITTTGIHIGEKLHFVKDKKAAIDKLNHQLSRFDKETKRLKAHKVLILKCMTLNFMRLILYYSIPYFCAKSLQIDVSLNQLTTIIALSSFVSMINAFIPIPGASGGTEATFVVLFSLIFDKTAAAGCMLVWRFITYYSALVVGGIVFIGFKAMKRKEENELLKGS